MTKTYPKILAILGYPLGHSLSPAMQQAALSRLGGIPWYYIPLEVSPSGLGAVLKGLRALENFAGANVTIPHKTAVLPFLDSLSPEAEAVGAVNTIVVEPSINSPKKSWKGYNTDIEGFLAPLGRRHFTLVGKSAVILGAGGAARAVLYALLQERVKTVTILCRRPVQGRKMAADLEALGRGVVPPWRDYAPTTVEIHPFHHPRVADKILAADLLINTTPLGMNPGELPPVPMRGITSRLWVYDLIYYPPLTPLLKTATRRGAKIINGQEMLIAQGAAAFRLWTGMSAPSKIMAQALNNALKLKKK